MSAQSAYVKGIKISTKEALERQEIINSIVYKCNGLEEGDLPPISFINIIGSDSYRHFKSAMCGTFSELMRRFKLNSSSYILDIGSGCGRMAFPFSFLLEGGKYYGIDVWKDGVDWCNNHFSSIKGGMEFHIVEAKNNYYFVDFKEGVCNDFSMHFIEDGSIDLAFAISCFTHLVEKDCRDYFREISRVLKPGGSAYLTGFVIDRFFFEYVQRTGKHAGVREVQAGCYHAYTGQDFFGGFTPRKWDEMFADSGLEVIARDVGNWAEKPGATNYQDVFIVGKM